MKTQHFYTANDYEQLIKDISTNISMGSKVYYMIDEKGLFNNDNAFRYVCFGYDIFDIAMAFVDETIARKLSHDDRIIMDKRGKSVFNYTLYEITL